MPVNFSAVSVGYWKIGIKVTIGDNFFIEHKLAYNRLGVVWTAVVTVVGTFQFHSLLCHNQVKKNQWKSVQYEEAFTRRSLYFYLFSVIVNLLHMLVTVFFGI